MGTVPDVSLFYFPAITVFNDTLYVAFQSADSSNELYYVTYDGDNWSSPQVVPGVLTDYSPAMAVWEPIGENKLYLAHSGSKRTSTSNTLWYTTFDGTNWTTDTQVPNVAIVNSPGMTFYNKKLFVAFQGLNNTLVYRTFDGTQWSGDKGIPGASMNGSPSMAVWTDQVFIAYSNSDDPDNNGQIFQTKDPGGGGDWWPPYPVLPGVSQKGGRPIYPGSSPGLIAGQDGPNSSFIEFIYSDANGQPVW
jgi:hypothetical protein